jgi:hypothetical protein
MKSSKGILFLLFLICYMNLQAQQVVATTGAFFQNTNGSMEYTLGESVITTLSFTDKILTQGFHQSRITVTAIEDLTVSTFDIQVYPNPASEYIVIRINTELPGKLHLYLYDINSKLLVNKKIENLETIIPFKEYPPAIYLLRIIAGKETRTYQIIKQ